MIRRSLGALVALGTTVALLVVPVQAGASPARPANGPSTIAAAGCPVPFWGIFCSEPYLSTPLGPLAQATQINGEGGARPGKYSPVRDQFLGTPGWMLLTGNRWYEFDVVQSTDGVVAPVKGYGRVYHPVIGEVLYATQYFFTHARWGVYSFRTKVFNPTDPWYPIVT